jgi:hypothetical protein
MTLYVNGSEVTDFSRDARTTWAGTTNVNQGDEHIIGGWNNGGYKGYDGYLAEVHFIDGTALDPTSFGETGDYGEWKAKKVSGLTYGTNGFHLDFKLSAATSSGLGNDANGSNNWTPTNLASTDQMVDTPTNNFATGNPLARWGWTDNVGHVSFSEGNLKAQATSNQVQAAKVSFTMAGKRYFETLILTQQYQVIGIGEEFYGGQSGVTDNGGNAVDGLNVYVNAGIEYSTQRVNGSETSTNISSTFTVNAGDILQFAYDADTGKAWFGVNNTWYGSGNPSTGANPVCTFPVASRSNIQPAGSDYSTGGGFIWNFGQDSSFAGNKTAQGNQDGGGIGDFYYTPPSGFLALCTKNLPDPAVIPSEHFNTVLYAGTSANHSITGVGFQPDLVWGKVRSTSNDHWLYDAVRGTNKFLASNTNKLEFDPHPYVDLNSFDTDGFSLIKGSDSTYGWHLGNLTGENYVSWNWKVGGTGSSNTNGTINTTATSANVDAGMSISTFTGTGSNATVGHGLSKAPEMVMVKNRGVNNDWHVYVEPLGATDVMILNLNYAKSATANAFNSTAPTSTVFSVGSNNGTNQSSTAMVAYCFHSVDGYSKVGSYTGNGSPDGTFVYTGFDVMWLLIKKSSGAGDWVMLDSERTIDYEMYASGSNAESHNGDRSDFTSNGFKLRSTSALGNTSGATYIYLAFAKTPFKYSNAVGD